jgi:hypothetical protein
MKRKSKKLSFAILIVVWFVLSCSSSIGKDIEDKSYTIPYSAEGNYKGLYQNLVKSNIDDIRIKEIVDYAKMVAIEAGYEISDHNSNRYVYNNKTYPYGITVWENSNYYLVNFNPIVPSNTSLNLVVAIEKKSRKIILIFKGS